jgi:hypothetical protein
MAEQEVPTITIHRDEWLAMHKHLGEARGLLMGWSYLHHSQHDRVREATAEFLARSGKDADEVEIPAISNGD